MWPGLVDNRQLPQFLSLFPTQDQPEKAIHAPLTNPEDAPLPVPQPTTPIRAPGFPHPPRELPLATSLPYTALAALSGWSVSRPIVDVPSSQPAPGPVTSSASGWRFWEIFSLGMLGRAPTLLPLDTLCGATPAPACLPVRSALLSLLPAFQRVYPGSRIRAKHPGLEMRLHDTSPCAHAHTRAAGARGVDSIPVNSFQDSGKPAPLL